FPTMLLYAAKPHPLVTPPPHSTPHTLPPPLQIIKTKPPLSRTSPIFFIIKAHQQYIFPHSAINPQLHSQPLPQIPLQTPKSPLTFPIHPKLPILTFSTKPSPKSHDLTKVQQPVKLPQQKPQQQKLQPIIHPQFQFHPPILPPLPHKK
ncbi:phosphate acyltransferase, partial [Staphylococcus aureus]|uniref:phosphate acyltransferase n=1 Tax=Staphylococcus aureus TaxID=1280 RepID=UPI0021B227FF